MTKMQNFLKGLWKENPVLVSMLGLCPVLGITTTLENALGMGIAILFVLTMSNLVVSLIRHLVPHEIRIPVYIVIIATLVTIVDMVMGAFLYDLHQSLGIFIPLIVVNCVVLGRAEAFASKNTPGQSVLDAVGMAAGFTLVIAAISIVREFLGTGGITVWGNFGFNLNNILLSPEQLEEGVRLAFFTDFYTKSFGAFIVLGLLLGISNAVVLKSRKKAEVSK